MNEYFGRLAIRYADIDSFFFTWTFSAREGHAGTMFNTNMPISADETHSNCI